MANEKIGPMPEPIMTDEELIELMENIFTPGAGALKTVGKAIPKIGKEGMKILNKILNRNKKAIKNIEQSNKIKEKAIDQIIKNDDFFVDLARRNPKMVVDAKRNFIGPSEELQKIAPVIQEQLARATGRMPMSYTPVARTAAEIASRIKPASISAAQRIARLSPLLALQSDSELQESFPDDDDLNFPSILEELISEPR